MPHAAAHASSAIQRAVPLAVAVGPRSSVEGRRAAAELAARLALPLHDPGLGAALVLVVEAGRLALLEPATRTRLALDYTREERRRYLAGAGRDPLLRAVGGERRIVDATAGLGRDAIHLAWAGRRVVAIERHPAVATLLADAIERAQRAGALETDAVELAVGDAAELLAALEPRAEVVYLDPMFPEKRRPSAAARKEMRLLRLLVGEGEDAQRLFAAAREAALERVVVKRADDAPPLAPHPTVSYRGKLVRYDVYRTAGTRRVGP